MPFVHRLSEEVLRDSAHDTMEVPDLLAVFSDGGDKRVALIEVKTGDELTLVWTRSYLEKLNAYAELLNLPLLVAWRPRRVGFWMLERIPVEWNISSVCEIVGAFLGREVGEEIAECVPERLDGSGGLLAQQRL